MTVAEHSPPADHASETTDRGRSLGRLPRIAFGIFVTCLAAFLLYRSFGQYHPGELWRQVTDVPVGRMLAAGGFAAASYATLTFFDYFALRYTGHPLPYRQAALASFTSLSLGHNIGFAALSSGAIRYRFYSRWGLGTGDVARVIVYCGLTVGIGLGALAAVALALDPAAAARLTGLDGAVVVALAGAIGLVIAGYLAAAALMRGRMKLWRWELSLPEPRLALAQLIIGPLNFFFVAACLHQALAAASEAGFLQVVGAYALANIAALTAHVPGGLGVIETVVMMALPGEEIAGGLLLFRFVYFLVPFILGLVSLGLSELLIGKRGDASAEPGEAA